ncbi:MAG: cysteine desulfurase-like protein [Gemmataceae bacterium]|nr:cysteine desulfurase-like protein [Gemmataceae bacterium]
MTAFNQTRSQFPALTNHAGAIFFDGPAGTQVPQRVIDAIVHYLAHTNANHGGVFATSVESDRVTDAAHQAMADFLNAPSPGEILFGNNMTSLAFHLSRSVAKVLKPGDEVMVTRLDHDANVSPWVLAARDAGATVRWISVNKDDCTLDLASFRRQISDKTKWVAVGLASNGVGTINDVATITREAKQAGATVFLDAVHYAPHGPIDVQSLGCDFLACSAYKFFGPHVGILWGRRELLETLPCYKVRPSSMELPGKWMTGTQNHECLAGVVAAVDYLADLAPPNANRRARIVHAMSAIRDYEKTLSERLLNGLAARPRFRVLGIRDVKRVAERAPTISITAKDVTPQKFAEHLASRQIFAWAGNSYALEVSEQLGLEPNGFLRLGMVHYNTPAEIDRVLAALDEVR